MNLFEHAELVIHILRKICPRCWDERGTEKRLISINHYMWQIRFFCSECGGLWYPKCFLCSSASYEKCLNCVGKDLIKHPF